MKKIGQFLFSLYLWFFVSLITVFVSILILVSYPFSRPFDPALRFQHQLGNVWAQLLVRLNRFWKIRVSGKSRIDPKQTYVVIANHSSLADIVCLYLLGMQFKWLAKKSLFRIPFLGWSMGAMGYIPLERGRHGSIRISYQKCLDRLKKGVSVLIFPEGTRSRTGEMGRFKSGAFRLAIQSGRPLLPVVVAGTKQVISKGQAGFGNPGLTQIKVLDPVETKNLTLKDEEELRRRVEGLMRKEIVGA